MMLVMSLLLLTLFVLMQKADVETDVIPPLNSLQFMFQGPSNLMRKRYHKLLDYENADNRLGNLKDGDLISTVGMLMSQVIR